MSITTISTLTSLSVVIIAIQVFVIMLVPAAIFYFSIRGIGWVQTQVRTYGPQARGIFRQVAQVTEETSHKVAEPVFIISTNAARGRRIRHAVATFFAGKEVSS